MYHTNPTAGDPSLWHGFHLTWLEPCKREASSPCPSLTMHWEAPEGDSSYPQMIKTGEVDRFHFDRYPFGNVIVIKEAA